MARPKEKKNETEVEVVRASSEVGRHVMTPDGLPSYYTNDTQIQTTPWDIRLSFGVITDVEQASKQVTIHRVADVRMSPQHAKKLLEILQKQLQGYEARLGPIPQPQSDDKAEK